MSWNDSNNNGSDQDPWQKPGQQSNASNNNEEQKPRQQSNNEQGPPDLEQIFSNLLSKLSSGGNKNNANKAPLKLGNLLPLSFGVALLIWGASGFYTIKEAERGVVTRFGKLHSIVQPGLNWKPTFIDQVKAVNVEQVKERKTEGSMLTQDENMVKVEMSVQYRIQDPAKYLFSVIDPEDSLNQATDSALRYVIGHMNMDDILTKGRATVREDTWKILNQIIAPYNMGLEVIDLNFQSARPPEEVKEAFDDAIKAQEDEQRYIREAEAYAREREPIARGDAQRIIESATAYKEQVVLDAQGEVERFQRILPEYKAAPEVMTERLYIQTMEKIMAKTPKVMLDTNNGNNLTILPLEQIMGNKSKNMATNEVVTEVITKDKQPKTTETIIHIEPQKPTSTEKLEVKRQGRFN